jgi:competence protein ComGC
VNRRELPGSVILLDIEMVVVVLVMVVVVLVMLGYLIKYMSCFGDRNGVAHDCLMLKIKHNAQRATRNVAR